MNRPDFDTLVAADLATLNETEGRLVSSLDAAAHLLEASEEFWGLVKRRKEADPVALLAALVRLAALAQKTVRDTAIIFTNFRRKSAERYQSSRLSAKRRYGSPHEAAAAIRAVVGYFEQDAIQGHGAKTIDLMLMLSSAARAIAEDLGILDRVATEVASS